MRVAIIIGSTRDDRFGPTPASWIAAQARQRDDLEEDLVDLAKASLPCVLTDPPPKEVADLAPRLAAADAFVVVTPEYNHSFPASLKNAIDWYLDEWKAKPVAFVSYGGMAGGQRAVEQLRPVFAEVHAATIRETISFHNFPEQFDADGRPVDPATDTAAKAMLDQLSWWADALRNQRAKHPYGA
ncbi:MAG: NADPH-dependent FMN reductase [Pseudonocardiaceae bacterium]|nr:NADPH-dependent FMN reductase [Pseudonocardiaceae bacterium]